MEKPAQRLRILLPAAVCTFLWGSAFPFIKLGYAAFAVEGPFSQILFAGLRFALAGLLLLAVLTVRGRRVPVPPKGSRLSVLRLGLVLTAGQYFFLLSGPCKHHRRARLDYPGHGHLFDRRARAFLVPWERRRPHDRAQGARLHRGAFGRGAREF